MLKKIKGENMETQMFKSKEFMETKAILPVITSLNEDKIEVKDLRELGNLLVIGEMGSPRCAFIHSLICGLNLKCSPDNVKMLLIDFMGSELSCYYKLPFTKFKLPNFEVDGAITKDYEKCLYAIDRFAKETVYRYHKIKEQGAKDIDEYNKASQEKMPYIVCVIEKTNYIKEKDVAIVQDLINQIASFSKETGVYLIYSMERLKSNNGNCDLINEKMLKNFSSKIIFRINNSKLLRKYKTQNFNREHLQIIQNLSPKKCETPYISDEERLDIMEKYFK